MDFTVFILEMAKKKMEDGVCRRREETAKFGKRKLFLTFWFYMECLA